jgi:probable HAF family extracellular repeat protein
MRSTNFTRICLAVLLTVLAIPALLGAQDKVPNRRARYTVMDVGTFGGPTSGYTLGAVIINDRGAVVGVADTSIFDPNCGCFVTHAFRWENGVSTDLGALPGGENSFGQAINSRGTIIGLADVFDPMTGLLRGDAALWGARSHQ